MNSAWKSIGQISAGYRFVDTRRWYFLYHSCDPEGGFLSRERDLKCVQTLSMAEYPRSR